MFDMLLNADIWLFRLINDGMQNAVFDFLAPLLTNKKNWTPIFIIVVVALAWKGGYRGRVALLLTIPVILLSDQISATFIKPMVARIRPCVALDNVNALIGIKKSFSFPSSHAANSIAAATLYSRFYPDKRFYFFVLAIIICFTRVYVGVHYPFDVVAGGLIGYASALFVYKVYLLIEKKYKIHSELDRTN
ncbi:MAG: phosphatase PAP2 family protein [Deferribacteres bacterium]|nr:phosphatase PAP2 family protein [candidate division KSB1 bacterium]MCB9504212.1 phosphatase PAP2 family protein [Deferribacteres bacterium]